MDMLHDSSRSNMLLFSFEFQHTEDPKKELGIKVSGLHSKAPHVVTVLWLDSDGVVTILSPTSDTSGRLQHCVSVPPWFLHSDWS